MVMLFLQSRSTVTLTKWPVADSRVSAGCQSLLELRLTMARHDLRLSALVVNIHRGSDPAPAIRRLLLLCLITGNCEDPTHHVRLPRQQHVFFNTRPSVVSQHAQSRMRPQLPLNPLRLCSCLSLSLFLSS